MVRGPTASRTQRRSNGGESIVRNNTPSDWHIRRVAPRTGDPSLGSGSLGSFRGNGAKRGPTQYVTYRNLFRSHTVPV